MDLKHLSPRGESAHAQPQDIVISFKGHSFGWKKNDPFVLKDLHSTIKRGSITAIVGQVGSGKSTLIQSILGETIAIPSWNEKAMPSIAYCSQEPWLEHTTIRQNIIGVLPFNKKRYSTAIFCSCLEPDFRQLQEGDQTCVGSKGLNISGGQKQRIALARTIYASPELILLDDIFSGMDSGTAKKVSERLLGAEGLSRRNGDTVILATHSQDALAFADTIITLEDGKIVDIADSTAQLDSHISASKPLETISKGDPINEVLETTLPKTIHSNIGRPKDIEKATSQPFTDERRKYGDLSVYKYYLRSSGYTAASLYAMCIASWIFFTDFPSIWLKWWSEANDIQPNVNIGKYMSIYAMFGVLGTLSASLAAWIAFISIVSNSATRLHLDLLDSVIKAPFSFFLTTDTGELTNRFSQDMELVDMELPIVLVNYTSTAFSCFTKAVILLVFSKYLGAAVPIFVTFLYFLQRFYLQTSRQVRLLAIEAKAPLYTHFIETVAGVVTIRAFNWQTQYQERNYRFIDASQKPIYVQRCLRYWLNFVLDIFVAVLCVVVAFVVVTWKDKFSAGNVGVNFVMIVGFNSTLARLITSWTEMESSVGAVARVKQFVAETPLEAHSGTETTISPKWPQSGAVELKGITAAYR
jgi:ABC-type multidrug transport system fused ATPase/permease subunit